MKGFDEVTCDLVTLFETEDIPYVLTGGLTVRIHAIPRPTYPRSELPHLYRRMEDLGYTIPAAQRTGWIDTVQGLPVVKCQVWVGDRAIDIDLFLAETQYQGQILTRRQRHRAAGLDAWFVSPEDLILLILAGRPKDKVDVGDVLFIQRKLDEPYLRS
jgi:hypothetical protein